MEVGFRQVRTEHGRAWAVGDLPDRQLRRWLEDPDAWLWRWLDHPVKIGQDSLIVQAEFLMEGGPVRVALKRYRARSWWKAIAWRLRPSRARRAWHLARLLRERQVAVARPLAACEPRCWLQPISCLATEWIEGAENLHLAAWRLAECRDDVRGRWAARCAERLGRLIGRMHAAGIAHRDLKAANLLVAGRGDAMATYLVDADGARICRQVSAGRRARNLARLAAGLEAHPWVGRTASCRFLRAYVAQFPCGTLSWKQLWRDVARRTERIVVRKRSRAEEVL